MNPHVKPLMLVQDIPPLPQLFELSSLFAINARSLRKYEPAHGQVTIGGNRLVLIPGD